MAKKETVDKISKSVDAAAAAQVTDMLYAQWGNLRGMLGKGLTEKPTDAEFDRMGMELVQKGKVMVTLSNGDQQEITIEQLRDSMTSLADNIDDKDKENGKKVQELLREQAAKLEKMRKDSAAMGKIKGAMAEAADENSGPLFGLSFGNAIGGLFSYLGKLLSWVFSGFQGEMPGFRDTIANYAA
ncbi:MAG: hypothetical protein EBV03_02255, partial [Proteobacteria bacterium]|nr:hypothetical protein [Pseudomonadota bacterium]